MRIKSYFAPSVQSAIGLARKEFGDDVTLITSHASSLEARHLGDYEVVFAIEDPLSATTGSAVPVAEPEQVSARPKPVFEGLLQDAISTKPSTQDNVPEKLEQIRTSFIELGIEPAIVRALMTMLERSLPLSPVTPAVQHQPVPQSAAAPQVPAITVPVIRDSMAALDSIVSEEVKLAFTAKPANSPKPDAQILVAATAQPVASAKGHLSAAEMAFVMSVSGGAS